MKRYKIYNENNENKPAAIILGGTIPHGLLIQLLKKRGFYTILIDYFMNPPAAEFVDIHYMESAMDLNSVVEVARRNDAQLIMSLCLDQQINIAIRASEELGIVHPFSSNLALQVTNKTLMKKIMMDGKIPTSKYYVVNERTNIDELELNYPVIVKPNDSCGSAGVDKLESPDGLREAIQNARQWGSSNEVIIEEYVVGTEMSVHCYVADGKTQVMFQSCRLVSMEENSYQLLCVLYLPKIKDRLKKELERIADQLVVKFGLPAYTPLFMQVIIKDDKISVLEFSPRISGDIASYAAVEDAGIDLLDCAVDSYIGKCKQPKKSEYKGYVCSCPFYCREGIFDHVTGTESLVSDGTIKKRLLLKAPGDHISTDKPSSSNVMKYVIEGNTPEECLDKLLKARTVTDIVDEDGNSIKDSRFVLTEELLKEKLSELI